MARYVLWAVAFSAILMGCHRHREFLHGDQPAELVGTWQLLIRSSCEQYRVKSDTMVLHSDGTFDQYVIMDDDQRYEAKAQRWQYMPMKDSNNIALHNRLEFFIPELHHTPIGTPVSESEVLILEVNSDPVIVLHPDSDCVYVKEH